MPQELNELVDHGAVAADSDDQELADNVVLEEQE